MSIRVIIVILFWCNFATLVQLKSQSSPSHTFSKDVDFTEDFQWNFVVDQPLVTQSAYEFTTHLYSLATSEANIRCPENTLTGIEAGLRASQKQSSIFVFTDAYSKDYDKFETIERLCRESHSRVMIFLSGYCLASHPPNKVDVYFDIARACSGAVFQFNTTVDLRQAYAYMKEITNTDWSRVTHEKIIDIKHISFSADSFTTDFMIVVSGSHPSLEVVGLNGEIFSFETIVLTRYALAVRLRQPEQRQYNAIIQALGTAYVTFYESNYEPFEFGFSTKSPRSLQETSSRPISGYTNYILIEVGSSIQLRSVEWLNLGDSVKQILYLKQIYTGGYVASVLVETGKMFQFWIIGTETTSNREIRGSSKLLSPQMAGSKNPKPITPISKILDKDLDLINYGADLTVACKVVGYPEPVLSWTKDGDDNFLPSETILLEIPTIYISYLTLTNVTQNCTLQCNGRNTEGVAYDSIDVFVNRTYSFDVIKIPEDATVEYGAEHYLYCQIDAYPLATTKWYQNDTLLQASYISESRVDIKENALIINNMGLEDVGTYKCIASNQMESKTFSAVVDISGVESPEIEQGEKERTLKMGDSAEIDCRLSKGKPAPTILWKYKNPGDFEYGSLPDGISTDQGKLSITALEEKHDGSYRCTATNILGETYMDFVLKIQSPPVIKDSEKETLIVKEDQEVSLPCDVDATTATVRWEMSRNDVIIAFDQRHWTDDTHTHHFRALWSDSANYHCIAENNFGKAERTVTVIVHVLPYIETPKTDTIYANKGGSVSLTCNVLYGNPAPSIRWEFTAKSSVSTTVNRNANNLLYLDTVSKSDEGSYLCIAENSLGTDSITFHLTVQ